MIPTTHNHLALILVHHHQINLHHNYMILTMVLVQQDQHIQELSVIPIISNVDPGLINLYSDY